MTYTSNFHIKKSLAFNTEHNDRLKPPNSLINYDKGAYEFNLNSHQARKLKNELIQKAKENYEKHTRQKFQAKNYEWSMIVSIKPITSMKDLEKLARHFSFKYGLNCYQIAIHNDEGYIDERGEKVINHHAHLEFISLDTKTGKNTYRSEVINSSTLKKMRLETAIILQITQGLNQAECKELHENTLKKEDEDKKLEELKQYYEKIIRDKDSMIEFSDLREDYFFAQHLKSEKDKQELLELCLKQKDLIKQMQQRLEKNTQKIQP